MVRGVADWCEFQKISLEELVERSGVDDLRVKAIVDGRWTPSPSERERIAGVFGVTKDDIAWGHKTPIQHIYGHGPG
ncbi:MAG: helix-turn-helix transcriptional regulator [Planctomycetota bacterium]|nr:helix-turn-helix transcriptional regulator [Planctomycetota bacterium]